MADVNKKIGERIKSLRQQKMMTQKELCGSAITRNMLSCIENGSANPSVKTLEYIAERLNVPAGLLISGDEGSFTVNKLASIENIRKAYKNGSYYICIDLCKSLGEADDEISMLLSHSYFSCAKSAFNDGNLKSMCELLDEGISYSQMTQYSDESKLCEASCYFRFASRISSTFTSAVLPSERTWEDDLSAFGDEFCRYTYMLSLAEEGKSTNYFPVYFNNKAYIKHVKAAELIFSRKYSEALEYLKELIYGDDLFGLPMLYIILKQAELCARNTENYKLAYEFSNSSVSVLDRMVR